MDILVLGSIALDTVETPTGRVSEVLGGSGTYFSYAAQFFAPVHMVSVIGSDFPHTYINLFKKKNIDLKGVQKDNGKTFRWKGYYGDNLNDAQTLKTELNVLARYTPKLPESYRSIPAVFLANFDPEPQMAILKQMKNPRLVVCDTMNLWINTKKKELLKLLKRIHIFILNDLEAKQLTGTSNTFRSAKELSRLGPQHVVIKKGEHGCLLYTDGAFFTTPCYPLEHVHDPTGAGDTFAGGFVGYLASKKGNTSQKNLKSAVIYGSVLASFAVEDFSLNKLKTISWKDINLRFCHIKKLMHL